MIAKGIYKCIFLNFYERNLSHLDVQMHSQANVPHSIPEHSPINLFGSLLTITDGHMPNCQLGKAFSKTSVVQLFGH